MFYLKSFLNTELNSTFTPSIFILITRLNTTNVFLYMDVLEMILTVNFNILAERGA